MLKIFFYRMKSRRSLMYPRLPVMQKDSPRTSSQACAGSLSLVFVQSIDYTRTRLGVDARRPGGQRQFTGIVDVYVKTVRADGVIGFYRGFGISCTCIFIYRGLYFGLFDSIKPLGKEL